MFVPLENQCSVLSQNSEAFCKSSPQFIAPVARKFSVFFCKPSATSVSYQMRRIEHNKREGLIRKRKSREVGLNVRVNNQLARTARAGHVRQRMRLAALVHKYGPSVSSIKPEHARSAADIKNRFFAHDFTSVHSGHEKPFPSLCIVIVTCTALKPLRRSTCQHFT